MSNITIVQGDITNAANGYIFHGVNCQGAMGSGVARCLYEKWGRVKTQYHTMCGEFAGREDELLGTYQVVDNVNGVNSLHVVNAFTQYHYGGQGNGPRRYAQPMAIEWSLRHFAERLARLDLPAEHKRIHLPKIGGELGGLDFELEVMPVIERVALWYPSVTLVLWEYKP